MSRVASFVLAWLLLAGLAVAASQNIVVVLDDSGSMEERMPRQPDSSRLDAAKKALLTVLETLPDEANVGIVLLNGRIGGNPWLTRLGPVDVEKVRRAMRGVRASGGTPLGSFMKQGADELLNVRGADVYGNYRLLILTDGEATDPRKVARYLPDILARGITLDVIGVDMPADHSLATAVHSYRRADDPAELLTAVSEVFAETSADSNDAGESDFELLEGIPSEWAKVAIATLAERDNVPIGEVRSAKTADGDQSGDGDGTGSAGGSTKKGTKTSSTIWRMIFVAVVVMIVLSKAVKRQHR